MERYLVISNDESGAWHVEDFADYKEAEDYAEAVAEDGMDAHITKHMDAVRGKVLVDDETALTQPWKVDGYRSEAEWGYEG